MFWLHIEELRRSTLNGVFFKQIFYLKKTVMKNLKFLIISLVAALISSCSLVEKESSLTEDDLTLTLKSENLGVLKFENKTYVFNKNPQESISKFIDKTKVGEFNYVESSLNLKEDSFENLRVVDDSFQITNSVSGEFIEVFNLSQDKDGLLNFDIKTSTGVTLEGFNYLVPNAKSATASNARTQTCWLCWGIVLEKLAEVILDSVGDNFDSNCAKAIVACGENGVANITIIDGWFEDSCEVECK